MSVAQRKPQSSERKLEQLRSQLMNEWLKPQEGALEPVIIEEKAQYYSDLLHLYVIWAKWAGLPQRERSKIILEAYQDSHSEQHTRVSIAMGLTPEEAERMGIAYAPLETVA